MANAIFAPQLQERLTSGQQVFILDVRGTAAFDEWHIDHKNAQVVNIQTSKLIANGPEAYPEIPKDREIVTVCALGNASMQAADILTEHGYTAVSLDGGMGSWSEFYYPVAVAKTDGLELLQVIRPAKGCLSYVLVSDKEAMVVDAGRHIDVYRHLAADKGVEIKHILDTHCHADHISGGPHLAEETGAQYWISESEMQGQHTLPFDALYDGLKFEFGTSTLEVIALPTPGHTPGSVSFLVNDKYLLSGDTVFVSGLGRPDLGGKAAEWAKLLYETVSTKLRALPGDVTILPAHFASSAEVNDEGFVGASLEAIRKSNELLQGVTEEQFTSTIVGRIGQTPPNYDTIVKVNLGLMAPSTDEAKELEIGPNRCAAKHLG